MNKIAVNTFLLSSSQIISRLISFVYFIILARVLGVSDFGVYIFTVSIAYDFIPVADFGIEKLILKDISREPERTNFYLQRLIPLRVILALVSYALLILFGIFTGLRMPEMGYLAVFGLLLFPYNVLFLIISFYSAKEKMKYLSIVNISLTLLTVILGLSAILFKLGLLGILFSYPAACLILGIVVLLVSRRRIDLGWVIDWPFMKKAISNSWIFGVFTVIAVFYLRITLIWINSLEGSESAGLYGSVFKFVEAIILIPQSLAFALFPLTSRMLLENPAKLKNIYIKSIFILFLLSLPVLTIMSFFSKEIIILTYGISFIESAKIMPILGLSLVLFFVNSLPGNIIQSSPKVKSYLPFAVLIFVFLLTVSYILISRYSIIGAAWAVVVGELFGLLVSNIFVFKFLKND